MNKHLAAFVLALLIFSGCAQLPVYPKPSGALTPQQRQSLYDRHRAGLGFWEGFTIGGNTIAQMSTPSRTFSKYAAASGDQASAAKARKSEIYNWIGLMAGLGGLGGGLYSYAKSEKGPGTNTALSLAPWALGGIAAELVIIEFGRSFHFRPAIKSFNEYLRRDLGLEAAQP